ncbi:unnamed protein product [Rotaria sordida]|uniref:Multiple inositol polyphosphate phosphatase 1 n=1 Tax=Rotaria sordida TaxID=392033 RepID=A0A814C4T8_9BILA|nr:unnamed protein product [Rotaria sordida]CAF0936067.1 unnamed protein product [Rotaria sordida]
MALYTTINTSLNENSTQDYPYQYLDKTRNMHLMTLKNVLNIDIINHIQLDERLARNLIAKGIILLANTATTYIRPNSLFIRQFDRKVQFEQSKKAIQNDLCSQFISNKSNIISVSNEDYKRYYSTKTPYEYPSENYILSPPPTGYKPICVQLLARHGSRTLSNHDYDLETLTIWQLAKQKNMLTPLGEQLKEDIELFMHANNHLGRGELTQIGKEEHFGIGNRLFNRLKSLFISSNKISVMTSGKKRTVDSAQEFLNGLIKAEFNNIQILNEISNKNLLYFHKSCTNYMTFIKTNPYIKIKLNIIKNLEQTKIYARQVLKRIYKNEFVELLINGNYNIDPIEKKIIKNEVDIVLCLYWMFSVAPAQSQFNLAKMLAKYFNEEESKWFAYINDAKGFYEKGPSIEGTTVTYDMAKPLLTDFFSSVSQCIETNKNIAAYLRFAHAETIIPLATLLQIPGFTDKAVHPLDVYTYENNQWRGDKIAPMAANIQWEIYQHENNHNQILVRMLYNEMEVRFKQDCKSLTPDSFFYDFNELKRSYADLLLPSVSDVN